MALACAGSACGQTARPEFDLDSLDPLSLSGTLQIAADHAELRDGAPSTFSGNVEITHGERKIYADAARFDPLSGRFSVEGDVRFEDPGVELTAGRALYTTDLDEGEFASARFQLREQDGRGDADVIWSDGSDNLIMRGVRYTTCPPGENDWRLIAGEIRIDKEKEAGIGRNVRVEFKGAPILYTPYISFPASDARKSGLLLPDYGNTDRSGVAFSVPYYWNIAPNYDALITATQLSLRGTQMGGLGRYLFPNTSGEIEAVFLADDKLAMRDRHLATWQHETRLDNGLRVHADISDVSDNDYFGDLSTSLAGTSITHLERLFEVQMQRDDWMLAVEAQAFQTIDDTITADNQPYKRLPRITFARRWDAQPFVEYGIAAELTHFERDVGVRGERFDIEPSLSLPFRTAGVQIVPEIRLNHRQYALNEVDAGADDRPSATVPIYSLDGRMFFERTAGQDGAFLHTFEPRIRYTHIPFIDQSTLPVFDTGLPDFNLVQLFRDNRYQGVDRIGDTDTLSVGFTSRLFNTGTGQEMFSATLGQAVYLSDRDVQLPDRPVSSRNVSNLIAEVAMNLSTRWNANLEYQWRPDTSETARAIVRVQYRLAEDKVINLGYRFQDQELEQSDVSFAWPVGRHWSVVGRWNYSLVENTTLERFAGVEYERCCWSARLVSRSYVNNRDGSNDTAVFAQFELKGLTSIGTRVDAFLQRGILGYGTQATQF